MLEKFITGRAFGDITIRRNQERLLIVNRIKVSLMRFIGYLISQTMYLLNQYKWIKPAHPEKIIWINPNSVVRSIEFTDIVQQRRYYLNGIIMGGDWDKGTYTVYHLHDELFEAFESRFFDGQSYLETPYFKQKKLSESALMSLAEKYKNRYDNIYAEVTKDGFSVPSSVFDYMEAFKVSISSDGRFLFMTGKHRLAIAKLMGDNFRMPVKVSHRHEGWQKLRDQLYADLNAGKISNEDIVSMDHPDLLDLIES